MRIVYSNSNSFPFAVFSTETSMRIVNNNNSSTNQKLGQAQQLHQYNNNSHSSKFHTGYISNNHQQPSNLLSSSTTNNNNNTNHNDIIINNNNNASGGNNNLSGQIDTLISTGGNANSVSAANSATASLVSELLDPKTREQALVGLSKNRESCEDLASLLWHSFGKSEEFFKEEEY